MGEGSYIHESQRVIHTQAMTIMHADKVRCASAGDRSTPGYLPAAPHAISRTRNSTAARHGPGSIVVSAGVVLMNGWVGLPHYLLYCWRRMRNVEGTSHADNRRCIT